MFQDIDRVNLQRAMRHPANLKPMIFCSASLLAIGIVITILGVVIVLLDKIEMGPPQFDEEYERYQGSSLANIIGPMFVIFGSLMTAGNICMLAYSIKCSYQASVFRNELEEW